jgi:hypothetical protein
MVKEFQEGMKLTKRLVYKEGMEKVDWGKGGGYVFNDGVGWGLVVEDSLFFAAAGGWRVAELQSGAPSPHQLLCRAPKGKGPASSTLLSTHQVLRYFTVCCTTFL